jgi:hypothetical protein
MNFWFYAHETVPSCGDDEPRLCIVALESGAIALARFVQPKFDRPHWDIDSKFDVTHWAFIPDVPEESSTCVRARGAR